MNAKLIITSAVLALALGVAAPAFAQDQKQSDKRDQPKQQQQPAPQQQRAQQQQNQNNQKQAQQQRAQQQQNQNNQKQAQRQQQPPQRTAAQQRVEQTTWQNHRAGNWQSDHRNWQQRGGYNGYRVPDDRYSVYFGQRHAFRIYGLPFMVYGGYPRFQYNGYWITLLDPWPGNWSNDWYDTDDVYVAYENGGYYLYNNRYPGIGIAVSISM